MPVADASRIIAAMGQALGPDIIEQVRALYDAQQAPLAAAMPPLAADLPYGPHPRNRLDIYRADAPPPATPLPILVFVHGGGFLKGDKGGAAWPNANVGRMAARAGLLGVVINYRLAPDDVWPAGAQDVAATVEWLVANAAQYGGDAGKIILMGTSAGAVHVAACLARNDAAAQHVRGAVLLSGLYGYTPLDERDCIYYGPAAQYPARMPKSGVNGAPGGPDVPLFIACAQHDPARFQAEFLGLMNDRLARDGTMPRAHMASGHNHYSMAMHLGSADTRLSTDILAFIASIVEPTS
ncbi:MAG: alpha/beta hydrolase [Sphingopyxis sp.]